MSYAALIIGGATLAYGIYNSETKKSKANKALKELSKNPYADRVTGQQIYQQADQLATGLTPDELAMRNQIISRDSTKTYRTFADRNPTLAGVGNAIANDRGITARLGVAAENSATRRTSLWNLIGLIGGQSNMKTGDVFNQMQAYGTAVRDQEYNQQQAINQFGNTATMVALNNQNENRIPSTPSDQQRKRGWGLDGSYGTDY